MSSFGLAVPAGDVATRGAVGALAARLGFPVVLKAVSSSLAHKSEAGGVRVGLMSPDEVELAAAGMSALSDHFLVERMVSGAHVELIVGVHRDPQFGLAMTIGAGGVLVELIHDTVTLLLPATADDVRGALSSLRIWPLLRDFRGRPSTWTPSSTPSRASWTTCDNMPTGWWSSRSIRCWSCRTARWPSTP
ncbi:MAG: acetate--CoA ligase family protein [Nocardioidaceae bacterium]